MAAERQTASDWIGEGRSAKFLDQARSWVDPMFAQEMEITNEAVREFQSSLPLPDSMSNAREVFVQAVFRLLVMLFILLLTAPIIAAAVVDGVTIRMKKQEMLQSENPRVYHFAKKSLVAIVIAPFIIAILPLAIGPYLAVAWCGLVACGVWGMAQNVEREI